MDNARRGFWLRLTDLIRLITDVLLSKFFFFFFFFGGGGGGAGGHNSYKNTKIRPCTSPSRRCEQLQSPHEWRILEY